MPNESNVTPQQRELIHLNLQKHLRQGLGTQDEPCTIAAINLALTGRLTDELHPCVSPIVRAWVIKVQDAMPGEIRNGSQWRAAAEGIAGSAADESVERRRVSLLLDWM